MLEVAILNHREHFQVSTRSAAFNIGSGHENNEIVIDDDLVSDYQCHIEIIAGQSGEEKIVVTNLGGSMVVDDNSRLHHLVKRELSLPCSLGAGETQIQICASETRSPLDSSIQHLQSIGTTRQTEVVDENDNQAVAPSAQTLSSWFESLGQLQRSTAGQAKFFKLAARCVFNPGGLDGCIILRKNNDKLSIVAQHIPFPEQGICYRKDLVNRTLESGLSIYHDTALIKNLECDDLHSAIVCPIVDANQDVAGVVYGFRNNRATNKRKGIRQLEAKYVNLIADAISAGLIRLSHEADRARQRVLLEQAFSPEVAQQLEDNPDILNGREREISVLFADLRGFCRISEEIGATLTYQLLRDVMNRFTQIVHDNKGVVIDYYGDGMSAFWNAPVDQENHAQLAVQAGMSIQKEMSSLNDVWSVEINQRLRVGVGIHTGNAQVGNSGSQKRLKYGPQGSTVNIASRIEQSTKKLGVNLVISGETASRIKDIFVAQRICEAKLNGIQNTTDLYTPVDSTEYSKNADYYLSYDKALAMYESGELLDALEVLSSIADRPESAQPMLSFLLTEINKNLADKTNPTIRQEQTASGVPTL